MYEVSTTTKARADRKADVRALLIDQDVSLETFVQLCWEQPEVEFIDLYRFIGGVAAKIQDPPRLERGFNPSEVEHLLLSIGPGRYRLSPYWAPDRRYVTSRQWALGDISDEPQPILSRPLSERNGAGLDLAGMSKAFETELKGMGLLENWKDFILQRQAASEARADAREMKPIEMFITALNALKPAAAAGPDPAVAEARAETGRLRDELAARDRATVEALQRKIEALEARGTPAATAQAGELKDQIASVISVAAQLGMTKPEPGAGQAGWTPGAVKEILESATPILQPFIATMDKLIQSKAGLLEAGHAALTEVASMPAQSLPPQLKEMILLTLSALKDKNFDDVYHLLDQVMVRPDGSPLILINPKVSPAVYLAQLRQLIPEIDQYRAELTEFLRWVEVKRAEDLAAAQKPAAVA
jgi:hypothetical protein